MLSGHLAGCTICTLLRGNVEMINPCENGT